MYPHDLIFDVGVCDGADSAYYLTQAHRVVGVTPCEPVRRDLPAPQHVRERECRSWLELHGPDRPWVAIDDVPWLFTPGCPHLLLTDHRAGFSLANASHLHAVLQRLSS